MVLGGERLFVEEHFLAACAPPSPQSRFQATFMPSRRGYKTIRYHGYFSFISARRMERNLSRIKRQDSLVCRNLSTRCDRRGARIFPLRREDLKISLFHSMTLLRRSFRTAPRQRSVPSVQARQLFFARALRAALPPPLIFCWKDRRAAKLKPMTATVTARPNNLGFISAFPLIR